jgi:hypothetical protein
MLNAMDVSYDTLIPNNVSLSDDRRVLKALEKWHPGYINWWNDLGPEGFQALREPQGLRAVQSVLWTARDRPLPCRPHIVQIRLDLLQRLQLAPPLQVRFPRCDGLQIIITVGITDWPGLTARFQFLGGELAQEFVNGIAVGANGRDQRLLDQDA